VALGRLNERVPPTPFVVRLMEAGLVTYQHQFGTIQLPWLAVEYVHGGIEGTTLEDRVRFSVKRTGYAFDRERAARALSHICQGLGEVHEVGVIHRDLTPGNVLCCGFGAQELFKIADFGIARPQGVDATFGSALIGTPGYIAPEQGFDASGISSPTADIFSLACIAYFVLAGEPYFEANNPVRALMLARSEARRSITEATTLCPRLREDPDACGAIDEALARATALDPKVRPQTARAFLTSVLSWLTGKEASRPSERHVSSVIRAQPVAASMPGWQWIMRHPPGEDRLVHSVGWDGDGHCLAATTEGLCYWDGSEWLSLPSIETALPGCVRFVRRIEPGRWLLGCGHAMLAEYSRQGVTRVLRGPADDLSFIQAGGDINDLAVVVAERAGWPPLLCGYVGGHWLKPLPVSQASSIAALARVEETRWLVAGRGADGRAFAGIYSPLGWEIEPLGTPESQALVACAGLLERGVALAVGRQGSILHVERGRVKIRQVDPTANLAAAAIDVLDRAWAGSAGQLWLSTAHGDGWMPVWQDPSWQVPFISILADAGLVVAMTVDGGVLECRTSVSVSSSGVHSVIG
jgi:hypothetical protein